MNKVLEAVRRMGDSKMKTSMAQSRYDRVQQ
jgi:hypothetical protein